MGTNNIYYVAVPNDEGLRTMDTLLGEATTCISHPFCFPSEKGSAEKRKNLFPFFLSRKEPFSEGDWCAGKKR